MNDLRKLIERETEKFHITLSNGLSFWSPYLINYNHTQDNNVPRGMGKATPEELRRSAEYIVNLFPNIDAESLRRKLIDGSLPEVSMNFKGTDCSGFVFNVVDQLYMDLFSKSVVSDLFVPKDNVLNGAFNFLEWQDAYLLSEEEASSLPENVPMEWVVSTFNRKAINLCNVATIVSDNSSDPVSLNECRASDLLHIRIKDDPTPHLAIVTDISERDITVAHSGRKNSDDIGGVQIETISHKDGMVNTMELQVPREFLGLRRLKSLVKRIQ